jgi:intracellular sulfur oxidation DsrE/DsrF family protein
MSPEFHKKWEHILQDVDKNRIPLDFIKKFIIKLENRRQNTINVERLLKQGVEPEVIEEIVSRKLIELNDLVVGIEFTLNVESIAEVVQPETDKLLNGL